ncbi:MAG: hypothetical protein ACM33B_05050 [Pseudomonadota bacterium]
MRTLETIHAEIEQLSEDRTELWHRLSAGRDDEAATEIKRLDGVLESLWDEYRATRAALRFGDRSRIVARARAEERLERAA